MSRPRPQPRRRSEALAFQAALVRIRRKLGWTQDRLASTLGISRRTLVSWECAYWLPMHKQRIHVLLALRGLPPEHVLEVADALGLSGDDAVAPLLAQFEEALEEPDPAPVVAPPPPPPPPPPRPSPDALRTAVDGVVRASADALDVRASDLRAAVDRVLAACGQLGANLDETRGAVSVKDG